ncbi:hypothetical protein MKQ70_12525 [Chitinophaga sedimenti]|uniref:hypothetical protein n=1 Tax=Chitinophaga sedimenti TaxID=2033606 RepID=UPI002004F793|nr:hypothetical protein [Chitinophaga sedimenti]MCK7555797.1 hypothetical protein [Chitinophaga sedimenti]
MIFEFSTSPETPTVTINYPARHDFSQMIHLNPVNESRQGNNRLLQQQEYAIYSTITKHHFLIQQDAKLCMRSDVPLINLFTRLKGGPAFTMNNSALSTWTKAITFCITYRLVNTPFKSQPATALR